MGGLEHTLCLPAHSQVKLPSQSRAEQEQAQRLRQVARDLQLSPEARAELDNALYKITAGPGRRWVFVMISPEQFRHVTRAVTAGPDAGTTLAVWNTAVTYMRVDTGEVAATREQLAAEAGTSVQEVSRAMTVLCPGSAPSSGSATAGAPLILTS